MFSLLEWLICCLENRHLANVWVVSQYVLPRGQTEIKRPLSCKKGHLTHCTLVSLFLRLLQIKYTLIRQLLQELSNQGILVCLCETQEETFAFVQVQK